MEEGSEGFCVIHQPVDGVGTVVQVGGGGGGTHEIWFEIMSVACDPYTDKMTLTVEPTWYTGGCTKAIPDADPYTGYVEVEDICSILSFYTAEWLEENNVIGRATYMWPREGECEPKWLLDQICGTPECT
jgi:hypothetical protein